MKRSMKRKYFSIITKLNLGRIKIFVDFASILACAFWMG
jgi:hypothetical protein